MKINFKFLKIGKRVAIYLASLVILIALYYIYMLLIRYAPDFSGLSYALTKAVAGILTLRLVRDLFLKDLKPAGDDKYSNETAYSIHIFAYAVIIAFSLYAA